MIYYQRDYQQSEKSSNHSRNKETYLSTQHVPFFSKNCILLTEKQLFIDFYSVSTGHCFSPQENFPKFGGKIPHFAFNKSY